MTSATFAWLVLQEAKRQLLTRWVAGATTLLCASSAFSVVLSTHELREKTASYEELLQQRVEAQLRGSGLPFGRSAEPGLRIIRKPAQGAVFAVGLEATLPAAWEMTPAGSEALAPYARDKMGINYRRFGDLAGIITGLGGLLALGLGVSTIVSDRVAGRVAAVQTLPVDPRTMAAVRLTGGAVTLAVIAVMWCVTVTLIIRLFVPADLQGPPLTSIWMTGPVASFLVLMFALGTAVGALSREGQMASVTTFLLWLFLTFVLPHTNQLVTRSLIYVPPRTRMEAERRDHMADEIRLLEQQVGNAMATQWLNVETLSEAQQTAAYFAAGEPIWREGLTRIRDAVWAEERQWIDLRARADRLQACLEGLNPSAWLVGSMAELAGTGRSVVTEWNDAIAAHDRSLNTQLFANRPRVNARVLWKEKVFVMAFDRRPAPRYSDLQAFVAPESHAGTWTYAALRNFASLAAYTVLAMMAAYFALLSLFR